MRQRGDKLGEKIQKCSDATELRNNISDTLDNIIELVNNYDELKQIIHTFAKDLSDYYQLVTSTTNNGRYEAGRLLIPVASTVIPIVGQIGKTAKVSKIKNALKAIRQSTKSQLDELNQALVTKARGAGVKGADEFPIRHNRTSIASIKGFSDELAELLSKQGLTIDEFKILQQKTFENMTAPEKIKINAIRNSIQTPNYETLLQKVIPKSDIDKYLSGTYKQVGGYVSTAKDAKHLQTYEDIYYGMRLDYKLSDGVSQNFYLSDESCGVIRYKTQQASSLEVPRYPKVNDPPPFTGHGFTSANNGRLTVPEWKSDYYTPDDGAELWEVHSDGSEILRAIFSKDENKFIPIVR